MIFNLIIFPFETFVLDVATNQFRIRILFDDLMIKEIPGVSKKKINVSTKGPAFFGDLEGKSLALPSHHLPFHRVLAWRAKAAYTDCLSSARSHIPAHTFHTLWRRSGTKYLSARRLLLQILNIPLFTSDLRERKVKYLSEHVVV